ncbi:MAG TPA: hypothetical protein VGN63_16915 [Flavisolibacter sp.]|jgi:hypothetical protein|nr:hypothetical protein [Flavisolibacter sp.]
MRLACYTISSPLLSIAQQEPSFRQHPALAKPLYNYWYATIYLLKTGFAKRPKAPI